MIKKTTFLTALGLASTLGSAAVADDYNAQQQAATERNSKNSDRIINEQDTWTHLWHSDGRGPLVTGIQKIVQGEENFDLRKYVPLKDDQVTRFRVVSPKIIFDAWRADVNASTHKDVRTNGNRNIDETLKGIESKQFKMVLDKDLYKRTNITIADAVVDKWEQKTQWDLGLYGIIGESFAVDARGNPVGEPLQSVYGLVEMTQDSRPHKETRIHTQKTTTIIPTQYHNRLKLGADFDTQFDRWRVSAGIETENFTLEGLFTPNSSHGPSEYLQQNGSVMNRSKVVEPKETYGAGLRVGLRLGNDSAWRIFAGLDALKESQNTVYETWETGSQDHDSNVIEDSTIKLMPHLGLGYKLGNHIELTGGVNFHPDSDPSVFVGGGFSFGKGYQAEQRSTTQSVERSQRKVYHNRNNGRGN